MSRKPGSRLKTHLLRIAFYVATAFWLAFAYAGCVLISTPETGRHSHLAGWAILTITAAVMIVTMDHWVKYLRVILAGGILGGFLATATGHLLNGQPFPRLIAAIMTALLAGCSVISQTLAKRKLTMLDRAALVGFLLAFVSGIVKDTPMSGVAGLSVGFVCLLIAWSCARSAPTATRATRRTV